MESYYSLLKRGLGRGEALRQVQRQFRDKTLRNSELSSIDWSHPHFWAAWQLSGDGGALPMGDRLPR